MSEDILEKARMNALLNWNGRGEVPPIIWNNMSQSERASVEKEREDAKPESESIMWFTFCTAIGGFVAAGMVAIELKSLMAAILSFLISLVLYLLVLSALHLRYWTMARPPSTSSLIKWEAEENIIIRVEKGVRQEGELTESHTE